MRKDFQNAFAEEFNIKIAILKVPGQASHRMRVKPVLIFKAAAPEVQSTG